MARCRGCGANITFVTTRNDKQQPVNADGSPHHSTCTAIPRRPKEQSQAELIPRGHCPNDCTQDGWIEMTAGVKPCPIHRLHS
jgi:hypothetical protein